MSRRRFRGVRSRLLRAEQLADPRIYAARLRLFRAYKCLAKISTWHDLGLARVVTLDALDLLNDLFGFD